MKRVLLIISVIIITGFTVRAQDTIRLKNGNELNGEVKAMASGVLTIKTSYSDSDIKVKWNRVIYIKTNSKYLVNLSRDKMEFIFKKQDTLITRISSKLVTDPNNPKMIILDTDNGRRSVFANHIVYFKSFNDSFISRLNGSVDVGVNLTKANNLKQINVSSSLGFFVDKWGADAGLNIVESQQDSVARVHRLDAHVSFNWYLPKRLYLTASTTFQENDELKLDLRSVIKVGLGFYIIRNNSLYWKVESGIAYNNEQYLPSPDTDINRRESAETYTRMELNLFDVGDLSLMTSVDYFSSLIEDGRFRVDFKFEAKYNLPLDLYIKAGTTLNYDNRPVVVGVEYDYIINTGLGWQF